MTLLCQPDWSSHHIQCQSPAGPHQMRVWSLGRPDAERLVVCVHGLTRSAQDFGPLASVLAKDAWVLCPDVVGRGGSDWLTDPAHYHIGQYALDMVAMAKQLDLSSRPIDWVGTSMGGLIGMLVAGQGLLTPRRLVLNDVGAVVSGLALGRIGQYLELPTGLLNWDDAEQQVRRRFAGFGPHTDAEWTFLTRAVVCETAQDSRAIPGVDGRHTLRFHHDPEIAAVFRSGMAAQEGAPPDLNLWPVFEPLQMPILLIRGAQSDLLSAAAADEMARRSPRLELATLPGVGHAPSLIKPDQISLIHDFLTQELTA